MGTDTVLLNPWGQSQTASARLDYTVRNGGDEVSVFAEVGGALRGFRENQISGPVLFDQASRVSLTAQETERLGALTGQANMQLGLGAEGLLPHKQFRLGGGSVEATWRNDTYRQASAVSSQPARDAHLVAFGAAGPVAYLRSGGIRTSGPTGENLVAGRLSLGGTPFPAVTPLSPLQLSVFSGVGTVWSGGTFLAGFDSNELLGDAGFGARYDISTIPHLDRWTAQSDFLQDLDVVAKFPVWASDPALIDPAQDELSFRWLIGVEL